MTGSRYEQSVLELSKLFEKSLDGFAFCKMIFDGETPCDFLYLAVNPAFYKLTGLHSVVGLKISDFLDIKDENSRIIQIYGEVVRTGKSQKVELFFKPLDRWLSLSITSPQKDYFIAVFDNISVQTKAEEALILSEQKFRSLVANIPGSVYRRNIQSEPGNKLILPEEKSAVDFLDAKIRIEYFSEYIYHITGYKGTDFINKDIPFSFFIHPEDIDKAAFAVARAIIDRSEYELEYRLKHIDGTWRWVFDHGKVTEIILGKLIVIDGVLFDITPRKLAEIQMEKYTNDLSSINLDKDKFISILAHDLKNPFHSILGFLNLLLTNLHQYDIIKIEKQLRLIDDGIQKAYRLLENTLLWTNAQSGMLPFEPSQILFSSLCQEIIEDLSFHASNKNITIFRDYMDDVIVFADKNMLKIILRNILSNALKFTSIGGAVHIDAVTHDSYVLVKVSDNGIGMNLERIAFLFNVSYVRSTSGTANESGSGLGLILCKEFLNKHHGEIWAESEIGVGTDFLFTLPVFVNDIAP